MLAHPDWKAAAFATVTRPQAAGIRNYGYLYMVIALVGTTIAPWMQFYLQASVVEKGITAAPIRARRAGTSSSAASSPTSSRGSSSSRARRRSTRPDTTTSGSAADAAQALRPLAGEYAYLLFAAGLFNASLFAASILPISTAYAVCEGLGFESGLDKKFHEAPVFYWLYTLLIVARRAAVLLIPRLPLVYVIGPVAGRQRHRAAVRPDLHAPADERPRVDGRVHEFPLVQRHRLDHRDRDDRVDAHPGGPPRIEDGRQRPP